MEQRLANDGNWYSFRKFSQWYGELALMMWERCETSISGVDPPAAFDGCGEQDIIAAPPKPSTAASASGVDPPAGSREPQVVLPTAVLCRIYEFLGRRCILCDERSRYQFCFYCPLCWTIINDVAASESNPGRVRGEYFVDASSLLGWTTDRTIGNDTSVTHEL